MMDPARTEPVSPSAMLGRHLGYIHTYIHRGHLPYIHSYVHTYIHTYIQTMIVENLLCMCAGWSSPASTYRSIVCWNSASGSPLHTMWTRVAKKNRVLSSVQHNPLAHHREGEEEEEEGGVVARGFWNLLCIIIIIIMHHSIVSAEKVRSALDEHGMVLEEGRQRPNIHIRPTMMACHGIIRYNSETRAMRIYVCMYACMYVCR